jgi:hypothetical protein
MLIMLRRSILVDGWNKLAALCLPDEASVNAAQDHLLLIGCSAVCVVPKKIAITVGL